MDYKVGQVDYKVGQNGAAFWITKWGKWITKWGKDYIVGQKDYKVGQGLQSGARITRGSTDPFKFGGNHYCNTKLVCINREF